MQKEPATSPEQTLAFLDSWLEAAQSVVYHIGCTRGPLAAYHHEDESPWPLEAIEILKADAPRVIEYLGSRHALEVHAPSDRIIQAAATWKKKRPRIIRFPQSRHPDQAAVAAAMNKLARFSEDGLPEQRRLDLDLHIAEGCVWRAGFPLLARVPGGHPFIIRGKLVAWAMWVQGAFADAIRDWALPDETAVASGEKDGDRKRWSWSDSKERWELANVVFPRSLPNTNEGPKKLAIEEARAVRDLVVAKPLIDNLFHELQAFVTEAARHPQGNVQPSRTAHLHRAVVELEELVGSDAACGNEISGGEHSTKTVEHHVGEATPDSRQTSQLKPSHTRAKELFEWAMAHIEGAESMTYTQILEALVSNPSCGGEGLPGNAEAFGRYCRAAGIRRNSARRGRGPGGSVRDSFDI